MLLFVQRFLILFVENKMFLNCSSVGPFEIATIVAKNVDSFINLICK